jgi:hypothetical protein
MQHVERARSQLFFAINSRPMALAGAADADHIVAASIGDEKRLSKSSLPSAGRCRSFLTLSLTRYGRNVAKKSPLCWTARSLRRRGPLGRIEPAHQRRGRTDSGISHWGLYNALKHLHFQHTHFHTRVSHGTPAALSASVCALRRRSDLSGED